MTAQTLVGWQRAALAPSRSGLRCPICLNGWSGSYLLWPWWTNTCRVTRMRSAARAKMLTSLRETHVAVGSAAHQVGVLIILTVILPPAYGTHLETAALAECAITTTRAAIQRAVNCGSFDRAIECHVVRSGLTGIALHRRRIVNRVPGPLNGNLQPLRRSTWIIPFHLPGLAHRQASGS